MKKFLFALCLLSVVSVCTFSASAGVILIDEDHFPDASFRNFLHDFFKDPSVETDNVYELVMTDRNIADLTGIEYFTDLGALTCSGNELLTLDLSRNYGLEYLNASNQHPRVDYITLADGGVSYVVGKGLTGYDFPGGSYDAATGLVTYTEYTADTSFTAGTGRDGLTLSGTLLRYHELIPIDVDHFPDDGFRAYVSQFDTNGDGLFDPTEIENAQKFYIASDKAITSLWGIEYFTNLRELTCVFQPDLKELDLYENTALTKLYIGKVGLTSLDLSGCTNLKELRFFGCKVAKLDLSLNTQLEQISCTDLGLTSINVSNCSALQLLDCENNALESIDVTGCGALEQFLCNGNPLTSLDVSYCPELRYLICTNTNLGTLELNCEKLTYLYCDASGLTSLDVSGCPKLETLNCANNALTQLDLSANEDLVSLYCYDNAISTLKLPATTATKIQAMHIENNRLTRLDLGGFSAAGYISCSPQTIGVPYFDPDADTRVFITEKGLSADYFPTGASYDPETGYVRCAAGTENVCYDYPTGFNSMTMKVCLEPGEEYIAVTEKNFPDANFRAYIAGRYDKDGDGLLSPAERAAVTSISVNEMNISSVEGLEYFPALGRLSCSKNPLTELDVSQNLMLTEISCSNTQVAALDVTKLTALQNLYVGNTQITEIDLRNNTHLKHLHCNNTKFSSLDVTKNTALTELYLANCGLKTLDLSNNADLLLLDVTSNALTALDLKACTVLRSLYYGGNDMGAVKVYSGDNFQNMDCSDAGIESLDVSGYTALRLLNCSGNGLKTLDVSKNTALVELDCSGNELTALDLSNNTKLYHLTCSNNGIETLDLENCPELRDLRCSNNKLNELKLGVKPSLNLLECQYNELNELDIERISTLGTLDCSHNALLNLIPNWSAAYNIRNYANQNAILPFFYEGENCWCNLVPGLDPAEFTDGVSYDKDTGVVSFDRSCTGFSYNVKVHPYWSAKMDVTVSKAPDVPVKEIALDRTEVEIPFSKGVGEECRITATLLPDTATYRDVTWSSGDETIVSITPNGAACVLKAMRSGVTTVTCAATDGSGVTGVCTVTVPCDHEMVTVQGKEPTCTETGLYTHYACILCEKHFKDISAKIETTIEEMTISPLGHRMTLIPAVAASCTAAGSNAYYHCSACTKYFKDAAGETETTPDAEVITAKGHDMTLIPAVAATCTDKGSNAYYSCSACTKYFKDEAGATETTPDAEVIPAMGHAPVDRVVIPATRRAKGYSGRVCEHCYMIFSIEKEIPILKDIALAELPANVRQIWKEAFAGSAIECAILPESCTRIEEAAFANCAALKLVEMSANVEWIAEDAFRDSPFAAIVAPAGSYAEGWAKAHHIPCANE